MQVYFEHKLEIEVLLHHPSQSQKYVVLKIPTPPGMELVTAVELCQCATAAGRIHERFCYLSAEKMRCQVRGGKARNYILIFEFIRGANTTNAITSICVNSSGLRQAALRSHY